MREFRTPPREPPTYPESPTPKPLRIHKVHNSASPSRIQHPKPSTSQQAARAAFPPRSSSLRRHENASRHQVVLYESSDQHRAQSQAGSFAITTPHSQPSARGTHAPDHSFSRYSATTGGSVVGSQPSVHWSDSSSAILGDFIAFEERRARMDASFTEAERSSERLSPVHARHARNPYEFEPTSPSEAPSHQTTFTDFIEAHDLPAEDSYRSHRSRRSEGNALYMMQAAPSYVPLPTESRVTLHRSESSPNVVQGRFATSRRRSPSPDDVPSYYYGAYDEPASPPSRRGRQRSDEMPTRQKEVSSSPQSPPRRPRRSSARSPARSPVRGAYHGQGSEQGGNIATHDRRTARSPTRTLDDVLERDEVETREPQPVFAEPKKRSRSPMKKMFGENGWLGHSPSDMGGARFPAKKTPKGGKQEPAKKVTVMGMIKNKLEEIVRIPYFRSESTNLTKTQAEKADMSPIRASRGSSEKHPKLTMLSISLGPPEQAKVYMELELMIVHTANRFLMAQFSEGRIAVDSIKKTVDTWRSRGRPVVIEFMYDQATQRDLVLVNQHNFRFYGDRAGNTIRINSMLYNWKQVAGLMAIRTFCDPDTIMLKLFFDIEQILELLGAPEGILLRLQHIRNSVNETMRCARLKASAVQSGTTTHGREAEWDDPSTSGERSREQSVDDPYGGMKLVPETYMEE